MLSSSSELASGARFVAAARQTGFLIMQWQACFFIGIAIVLYGHPVIGMLIEMFGFVNLFG